MGVGLLLIFFGFLNFWIFGFLFGKKPIWTSDLGRMEKWADVVIGKHPEGPCSLSLVPLSLSDVQLWDGGSRLKKTLKSV